MCPAERITGVLEMSLACIVGNSRDCSLHVQKVKNQKLKVIFNYRDNDILKQIDFYDWGLNSNDVFYEERIKIILQSLIEE